MSENRNLSSYRGPVILIAFVIVGAIIGLIMGESAKIFNPIGQIWLNMLFVLLVPLIFFSISSYRQRLSLCHFQVAYFGPDRVYRILWPDGIHPGGEGEARGGVAVQYIRRVL